MGARVISRILVINDDGNLVVNGTSNNAPIALYKVYDPAIFGACVGQCSSE